MQPDDRIAAHLWDVREAAKELVTFAEGRAIDDLSSDRVLRLAIERDFEIAGEAARRLPVEYCVAHPEIAWHNLIGRRNVLAHDYGAVKLDLLWQAIEELPPLIDRLTELLDEFP